MSDLQRERVRHASAGPGYRLATASGLAAAICTAALWLALSSANGASSSATTIKTFHFTNGEQTFTVPAGVTSINVVAVGGKGGAGGPSGATGGFGAVATADLPVAPGQVLFINVGGNGGQVSGGFNGGGGGGDGANNDGGGGGGGTDIRTVSRSAGASSLGSRLVIAGGGGGGGGNSASGATAGGAGGGATPSGTGGPGTPGMGPGGGSGAAGAGLDVPGGNGSIAQGGNGTVSGGPAGAGGGGGGGAFGGGGADAGGAGTDGGGGGGGGSSTFGATATNRSIQTDGSGLPLVRLTYDATSGAGGNKSGLKFGKVIRNKQKGTALLSVTVPGSGTLSIGGKGIVKKRPDLGGTTLHLFKDAPQAGTYKLKVKAKGRKKSKLFSTGKVKVKAVVTFKPTTGDTVSDSKRVKLKKN